MATKAAVTSSPLEHHTTASQRYVPTRITDDRDLPKSSLVGSYLDCTIMASRVATGQRSGARFAQFKLVLLGTEVPVTDSLGMSEINVVN